MPISHRVAGRRAPGEHPCQGPWPAATKTEKSTLQIEVKRFAMFIAGLAIVTGVIFFIIALATG